MVAQTDQTQPKLPTIRRKITTEDVEAMAELMAKRITETGACLILGIKPETWWGFKQRAKNESKFAQLLTRVREAQLNGHLENIERFQVKDWRASHALLQLKAPERFGQQQQAQASTESGPALAMFTQALAKLFAQDQPKAIVECLSEVKSLPESTQVATTEPNRQEAKLCSNDTQLNG